MDSGRSSPLALYRSNSLRGSLNRTSLVRRNQSMSAKQIRFFRNGDRYFNGLKLAVSNEKYKEFDSLLAELSTKLDLPTGAVRYIFNAEDSSIITDISQLQYGVPYVCSSHNTFREIEGGYGKQMHSWSIIAKSPKIDTNFNCSKPNILTNHDNNGQFNHLSEGESGKEFIKPKLVTVIRNGKPPQKKVTLLLNSKTAISLDQVLDQLSARGCLGKVDKLFTVDCHVVKSLKDLFDDDTVFIALQANEKFPEDGIELDPNSYRITPYRELKRPSSMTVKRSSSLRVRKYKDENQNMSSIIGHTSSTPSSKLMNLKVLRPKSTSMKQIEQNKEELYPTSVFESESSESARAIKGRKSKRCAMDIYNTVWLSDFESSVKSFGSRSGFSSLNQSQISFGENSGKIIHSTPKNDLSKASKCLSEDDSCPNSRASSKMRLHRTLSLPESELPHINGEDLQERFTRLQLEQENRELRLLTRQLQEALEKLEARLMIDIKLRESEKKPCPKCCCPKIDVSSETNAKPFDVNSPDSLEESSCKNKVIDFNKELTNPKEFLKVKDKNESGYSTFINESFSGSVNDDDSLKTNSEESFTRKGYHYMEYSEDCTSEEERHFYQSRLARKRKQQYDNNVCCITQ